ncbi:MAG: UvrD-helicase domain-containing protein [Cyanobacteriota bacterium]|nr:UvrD-helicase domain-containing protein [Cyanobacteriota bacterium]
MSTPLPPFEANGLPLGPGIRLLEASAGTGKTFALAHLVLRLLSEGPQPLALSQVLVVTYTEAAAAELRDRIARRLQQALGLLEGQGHHGEAAPEPADAVLQQWLEIQARAADPLLRGRLLLALEQLDQADITTIHGFCRRTLQRQALEAGLGPAVALETEAGERRQQLVHDYWLQQVLPLPAALLAGLLRQQINPQQLAGVLTSLDSDPALTLDPLPAGLQAEQPLAAQLEQLWPQLWHSFAEAWPRCCQDLEQGLADAAAELKRLGLDYRPYRLRPRPDRLERVQAWLDGLAGAVPPYDEVLAQVDLREYFHPGPFTKVAARAHGDAVSLPQAPLLQAIAALVDGPAELLLLHFAHWGRAELARRRERSGQMGFAQLLEQLDPGAATGTPLLDAVARRYRAALVDEFQDTDPIQWRILSTAFASQPARHLLVIVGDPKQAIYRFRGGELATYRQAAQQAEQRYGLTGNRRASAALVEGLNALMQPGLTLSALPVPAVQPRADKGSLQLPDGEAPLQLLLCDPAQLEQQLAAFCLALLQRGLRLRQGDQQRPLRPGDLCLLVSRHDQAEALRLALEQRQLPSRLVSKGDVFESVGAAALQRLLDALASPGDPARLRLLAASPLLGWSAAAVAAADAAGWDRLAGLLDRLAAQLPNLGLTAVVGQLLAAEGLARLALRGRALADLQQAAELVQEQMHRQGQGLAATADWLRRLRLQEERDPPEAHLCRSDAAESAIAVVTVHRSKGLEYPVVICPHLWRGVRPPSRSAGQRLGRRWLPADQERPRLDLHLSPDWGTGRSAAQQHLLAQQQEAERLAYVACTRAQHLLVLAWPGADQAESANPLSPWLLQGDELRALPMQRLDAAALPLPHACWQAPLNSAPLQLGPRPERPLERNWGRASYSAWAHSQVALPPEARDGGRDSDAVLVDGLGSEAAVRPQGLAEPPHPSPWPTLGPLAQLPRGAGPGDALHRMLEALDYPALAAGGLEPARQLVAAELARAGLAAELLEPVLAGLLLLVQSPLGGALGALRLADLPAGGWLNEMNFDLPLAQQQRRLVRSSGLADVFARHPGGWFGAAYAEQLQQLDVASRGFLTGSIDLVFCAAQRWWIVDWKSNWLGQLGSQGEVLSCGANDYSQEAMAALMASNHYPLQAHLYLVALHRYLQWRLPGYAPERHLGGYAYVFVRGVAGADALTTLAPATAVPGVFVDTPPLPRLLALDALLREGQP